MKGPPQGPRLHIDIPRVQLLIEDKEGIKQLGEQGAGRPEAEDGDEECSPPGRGACRILSLELGAQGSGWEKSFGGLLPCARSLTPRCRVEQSWGLLGGQRRWRPWCGGSERAARAP